MKIEMHISPVEEILSKWKTEIGVDFDGYKLRCGNRRDVSGGMSAQRKKRDPLFFLMLAEAVFLLAFAVAGFYFQPAATAKMTEAEIVAAGALAVFAMAIQNAFMKLHLSKMTMTTVMTGNVTQFSINLTKLIFGVFQSSENKENSSEITGRIKKGGGALLGFSVGAIAGAFLLFKFALLSILLPCLLIFLLAFSIKNRPTAHPN